MTNTTIKNTVIEQVKKMKSNEVRKIYGLMIEHSLDESLFNHFGEIPPAHKVAIEKGINDFKKGKKQSADIFIKNLKAKHA